MASLVSKDVRLSPEGLPGVTLWIGAVILTVGAMLVLRRWAPNVREMLDGVNRGDTPR